MYRTCWYDYHYECESRLGFHIKELGKNPKIANTIEKNAQQFIKQYCLWIQTPCPSVLFNTLQECGFYAGPIEIVASYTYDPVEKQVKDIFRLIDVNYEYTPLNIILSRFNQLVLESTCFNFKQMEMMSPQDRLLSLCMFVNEKISIDLDEKYLRGRILCLGQLAVRSWMKGDCCSWACVAGINSDVYVEKDMQISGLRWFIRHKLMEAVYASDRYQLFPPLKCALCDNDAHMICLCNTVRYCSRECQRANWKRHGPKCRRRNL